MYSFFKAAPFRNVLLSGLFATLTWPLTAEAVNRYVSDTGTDGFSGTKTCTSAASPCSTISYAVGQASNGDTIYVTYASTSSPQVNNVTINKHLNIIGLGATRSILNTNGASRHFTVSAGKLVTLTNLDLRGGVATSGGSIFNYGLLTLVNCQMSGNTATYSHGGAIYNSTTGTLVVNDSLIKLNEAEQNGGAIYNSGTVRVASGSTITGSTAQYGGGIYTTGGNTNVQINQDSAVSYNSAQHDGGGVYVGEGSTVQISDSSIGRNNAAESGGAVYAGGGNVTVTKSTFDDNSADWYGGAIYIHSGIVTVTTSLFTANEGDLGGGAIISNGNGSYSIAKSSFEDNSAGVGGAIFDSTDPSATVSPGRITASTFAFNYADYDGGAIYYNGYEGMQIVNSTFSRNTAGDDGGAMFFVSTGGGITIASSTLYGNAADYGATIYTQHPLTLNNNIVTYSDNLSTAAVFGDGIACEGPALPLAGRNNLVGTAPYLDPSCSSSSNFVLPGVTNFTTTLAANGTPVVVGVDSDPLETHALLTGSSALGAGWSLCPDPTTGAALTVDQRNQPRPGGAVAGCDVGSFELQ